MALGLSAGSPSQLAMNAPAAIAPTRRGLDRRKSSRTGPEAAEIYGLTMWFKVSVVTGCTGIDLGMWSTCSGLKVSFTEERFDVGGGFGPQVALPNRLSYEDITLKRAMNPVDSPKVRTWLNAVSTAWRTGEGSGWSRVDSRVIITVYSGLKGIAVAQWVLHDVVPASWSGPDLDAAGGGVAVETLVLRHNGFLTGAQNAPKPPALRIDAVDGGQHVEFGYLPEKLNITKSVSMQEPSNQMFVDRYIGSISPVRLDVSDLRVDGPAEVTRTVGRLWDWLLADNGAPAPTGPKRGPAIGPAPAQVSAADGPSNRRAKVLGITVGTDSSVFPGQYVLTSVDVSYTRFTPAGTPSRAVFKLTLEETGHWQRVSPSASTRPKSEPARIGAHRAESSAGSDPVRDHLTSRGAR